MAEDLHRLRELTRRLDELLAREHGACSGVLDEIVAAVRVLQADTADARLRRLARQLEDLRERLALLVGMARQDFLQKLSSEAATLSEALEQGRLARALAAVSAPGPTAPGPWCGRLLDAALEGAHAERGFVLVYCNDSTEAEVVAARRFSSQNLSLEEYRPSRTLLREVLQSGQPLLVEDAAGHPVYGLERSVRDFQVRSVLAVPLEVDGRVVGALYLENGNRPEAFDEVDRRFAVELARFAVFYLRHVGAFPVPGGGAAVHLDARRASREIVGHDPQIAALLALIEQIAPSEASVLILGESGTGKELVARALHFQSPRRQRPFVAINCAAIPDNLLEPELFGYERGAFTGALARRVGHIEEAAGGTLFLDEVSELAFPLQAKLLRFLQSGEYRRVGGTGLLHANVRVVAATSKDIQAMVADGRFQDALYHRLSVIPVRVPSLRDRCGDVPLLVDHFLERFRVAYGKRVALGPEVYDWLRERPYPGNIRELENLVHRLVVLARADTVRLGDVPADLLDLRRPRLPLAADPLHVLLQTPASGIDEVRHRRRELRRVLAEQERQLVERAIDEAGGNLTEAAARLGLHRVTVHKILRRRSPTR